MSEPSDSIDTINAIAVDFRIGWASEFLNSARLWAQKRKGRRALRELTDTQLQDIGLTRAEAQKEVSKSYFWD